MPNNIDVEQPSVRSDGVIERNAGIRLGLDRIERNTGETFREEVEVLWTLAGDVGWTIDLVDSTELPRREVCRYVVHDVLWGRKAGPICPICPYECRRSIKLILQREHRYRLADSILRVH